MVGDTELAAVSPDLLPPTERCTYYTRYYCEENVWKSCEFVNKNASAGEIKKCFAVFISNLSRTVPLWCQKASTSTDGLVMWDYHVIFIYENEKSWVYDMDSRLPFPCEFSEYSSNTFKDEQSLKLNFQRSFRVIEAHTFLQQFASDRLHMKNANSGEWLKPPPSYPCIQTPESTNNLQDFISMDSKVGVGQVFNLENFNRRFTHSENCNN